MMLFSLLATALAGPLPPPDFPHGGQGTAADDTASFGADLSVGYAHGFITAPWIDKGAYGMALIRYEAFARSKSTPGPRMGASIWASRSLGATAVATEPLAQGGVQELDVDLTHYGALAVLRPSGTSALGPTMGFGFGRAEVDNYYSGPLTLPVLTFELGARHKLSQSSFVDWMGRAHWATSRNATNSLLDEWWMVQFGVTFGLHAN